MHSVLIVDADPKALLATSRTLTDAGYLVTPASSFQEARQRLVFAKPDVLITTIRLAAYNGLHLVIRTRAIWPDIVAIVTHVVADPVLQADAETHDAIFLVKPVEPRLLLDLLARLLEARGGRRRTTTPRRWARKRPTGQVKARFGAAQGVIVDLSYGGIRLQLSQPVGGTPEQLQELALPAMGLALRARPIWSRNAGPAGPWWCGIAVDEPDPTATRAWCAFVDATS